MSLFNDNPFADDEEDNDVPKAAPAAPVRSAFAASPTHSPPTSSPPFSSPVRSTAGNFNQTQSSTGTSTVTGNTSGASTTVDAFRPSTKTEPLTSGNHTSAFNAPQQPSTSTYTPGSLWNSTTENAPNKRPREDTVTATATAADSIVKAEPASPVKRRVESSAPPSSAPPSSTNFTASAPNSSENIENDDDGGDPFDEYNQGEDEDDYNALVVRNAELESQLESLSSTLASNEQRMHRDRTDLQNAADTFKSVAEKLGRDMADLKAKHAKELVELRKTVTMQVTDSTDETSSSLESRLDGGEASATALLRLCGDHSSDTLGASGAHAEEVRSLKQQISELQNNIQRYENHQNESCKAYVSDSVTRAFAAAAIDPRAPLQESRRDSFGAQRCDSVRNAIGLFKEMIVEQKNSGESIDVDAVTNVLDALCEEFQALSLHAEKVKDAEVHAVKHARILQDSASQLQSSAREFEVIVGQLAVEQQVHSAVATAEQCNVHDETVQRLRDRLHIVESILEGILERHPQIASANQIAPRVVQDTMNRCKDLESRVNQLVAEVFYLRRLVRQRGVVEVVRESSNIGELADDDEHEGSSAVTRADAQQGRISVLTACCESLLQRCAWFQKYIFDAVLEQSAAVQVSPSEDEEQRMLPASGETGLGGSSPLVAAQLEHACEHMKVQDAYINALQTVGCRLQREAQFVSAIRLVALSGGNPSELSSDGINLQNYDEDSSTGEESNLDALRHLYNETVSRLATTLNAHLSRVQQSFERSEKSHLAVVALLLQALDAADGVTASVAGIQRVPLKQLGLQFSLPFSPVHAASITTSPGTASYDEAVREAVGKHQEQLIAEKAAFDKRYAALEKKLAWFTQHKRNEAVVKLSSTLKKVDELTKELEEAKATNSRSSRVVELQLDAANERISQLEEELNAAQRASAEAMAELEQWRQQETEDRNSNDDDNGEAAGIADQEEQEAEVEQEAEMVQPEPTPEETASPSENEVPTEPNPNNAEEEEESREQPIKPEDVLSTVVDANNADEGKVDIPQPETYNDMEYKEESQQATEDKHAEQATYAEQPEEHPEQQIVYSEQLEEQPVMQPEERPVERISYSEQPEEQTEAQPEEQATYSEQPDEQPEEQPEEQAEEQATYAEQPEEQTQSQPEEQATYSEQPEEQTEAQPEEQATYSEQAEAQPEEQTEAHTEAQPEEQATYSEQAEAQPEEGPTHAEQPEAQPTDAEQPEA